MSTCTQLFCFVSTASEHLTMGGMQFTTFDLGGHRQGKTLYTDIAYRSNMGGGVESSLTLITENQHNVELL